MENISLMDVLLENYIQKTDINTGLEAERENVFVKLNELINGNMAAEDTAAEFHYQATRAAFHAGFKAGVNIMIEAKANQRESTV